MENIDTACWDEYGFPILYSLEKLNDMSSKLHISQETLQMLRSYFEAACIFYIRIPLHVLFGIYNSQNPAISQADFLDAAELFAHEEHYYSILRPQVFQKDVTTSDPMEQELIADYLYCDGGDEACLQLKRSQEGREWYIPPKAEFLKYYSEYYTEKTQQLRNVEDYLRKTQRELKCPLTKIMDDISIALRLELPYQAILDGCQRLGMRFQSQQELRNFVTPLLELSYHTRKPSLCGFTPAEAGLPRENADEVAEQLHYNPNYRDVLGEMAAKVYAKVVQPNTISGTPARNAPCPCGRGKKYKNCCGKKK